MDGPIERIMKAFCYVCQQEYDETDPEQYDFVEAGCLMICQLCANNLNDESEFVRAFNPE
jgi:uncharacterized protein YuzB (UPF0349 family)